MSDKSNVDGNTFKSLPSQLKEKAIHRIMCGESATAVAKSMGVAPSTVLRWQKKAGVERGSALNPQANPMVVPQEDHVMDAFSKEVRNQNVESALKMFLDMQDGVEDKYRVLMAQQLYQVFHTVMQNPPPIKNWSDLDKAHKIMSEILNPNKGAKGGAAKFQLQFDVITAKPTVIDAEIVEQETHAEEVPINSGD